MAPFPALTHIAVTVSDMAVSTEWYTRLFGSPPVLDEDEESGAFHHAVFVLGGGTMFGLHTHTGERPDAEFDERRIGLDHVAFACTTGELEFWRYERRVSDASSAGVRSMLAAISSLF